MGKRLDNQASLDKRAPWRPGPLLGGVALALVLLGLACWRSAQAAGLPPLRVLRPSQQGLGDFCLSTTHDARQFLYVGNQDGILEYDGQHWRKLHLPGRTQARSVLALPGGRLAYGGVNEFGLFIPDAQGRWTVRALSDSLRGREMPYFREVRSIVSTSAGLFFQSKELLARWLDGKLQTLVADSEIGYAGALGDSVYIQTARLGLCRFDPSKAPRSAGTIPTGALRPLLGPGLFAEGNRLVLLLPVGEGRLLLGTRYKGLFLLERGRLTALDRINRRIVPQDLFHGIRLHDGRIALATLQGGVFLLDARLEIEAVFDDQKGLPGPMAVHLSEDRDGNLWVASTEGVTQLGLGLPYTLFNEINGLEGQLTCVEPTRDGLMAGSTRGLFRLVEDDRGRPDRFERLDDLQGICWRVLSTAHGELAIMGGHLVEVSNGGRILLDGQPTLLQPDSRRPGRVWVGVHGGIRPLDWQDGRWRPGPELPSVRGEITSLEEDPDGGIWMGTTENGAWYARPLGAGWLVRRLGRDQGLQPGVTQVRRLRGSLLLLNGSDVWEIGPGGRLRPASWLKPPAGWRLAPETNFAAGPDGLWFAAFEEGLARLEPGPRPLAWITAPYRSAGPRPGVPTLTRHGMWVLSDNRLILYKQARPPAVGERLPAVQLRALKLGEREYVGAAGLPRLPGEVKGSGPLEIMVACAHLGQDGAVAYSFHLEGLDKGWSPFMPDGHRRVDYLPPGRYTLRVRVEGGGHPVRETVLAQLHVPTPWHQWWWLRALGVVLLIELVLAASRRRARRLREMNDNLQAEVQERRRVETALRASEIRYRGLFENSLDAIFLLDTPMILEGNPAAARLFGRPLEELEGHSILEFSPERQENGRLSAEYSDEVIRQSEAGERIAFEWEHLKPDGTSFLVEVTLSPVELAGKRVQLAILRDVSERRQLETQLRQSQKMEAVGRLAGGVAHDFNNILVVILGQCDMLLMSLDAHDPVRDEVQQVRDAAQRAAQLTRQLLIFSRRTTLHPQRVSLNGILGDLEKMLRRVIGEDIRFEIDMAPDLARVNVDAGQMDQVILNLVVNARDAMKDGGTLSVRTRNVVPGPLLARETGLAEGAPHVLLSISDTGAGMTQEVQSHIFEPFFTTKEAGQGTGLGLATVYGIITQSDGRIRVQSEPGRGTIFHIYLPAAGGESLTGREGEARDPSGPRGSERLLLVEDEAAVREVLLRTLQGSGYEVRTAGNGLEALERLEEGFAPDLVLSDVVMPELGGFDLVRQLRGRGLDRPIVLMTGYTDREVDPEWLAGHDVSLLNKPFGPGVLLREVRARLDGPAT